MVAYNDFLSLSRSNDPDDRGQAAHLASLAYVTHVGPADEQAALYAALIGFLEDPSVKVRAALAYGLLHSPDAPRPVMLALLRDSPIISRAVLQYSPVLLDADILPLIGKWDGSMLAALAQRQRLSPRMAGVLIARNEQPLTLALLSRHDLSIDAEILGQLADSVGGSAEFRGKLLARPDLPARARLILVQKAAECLRQARLVKGALKAERLDQLFRTCADSAVTRIGEGEAGKPASHFAHDMIAADHINTRILLHALISGHVLFLAACLAELSLSGKAKIYTLLEAGSRPALNALFARCGLGEGVRNLLTRLVLHARNADLADDVAARHYVVTALTEELITEHDGNIPAELEEAFAYLSEQNIKLAREAARGVMHGFAKGAGNASMPAPAIEDERQALPAA